MDWTREAEVLRRIVALLLSLADMADWASHASWATRWRVLYYLRQAELVAQIADPARAFGAPPPAYDEEALSDFGDDSEPADAARLALRLRGLALQWACLLAWILRVSDRQSRRRIPIHLAPSAEPSRRLASTPRLDSS